MKPFARALPVGLVVLAPLLLLYPLFTDPLSAGEDDLVYFHPVRQMVGEALADGRWPLANEWEATGTPLMGDPQTAVLFPGTWLFAILEARTAYVLSIFLAFAIAGLGALLYLRRLGLDATASSFGALAFTFCGFMIGHRVHLGMIQTAAFLPWALWCFEGFRDRGVPNLRVFAWLVPLLFLSIAAGHWAALVHMALIWALYFVLRVRPFWSSLGIAAAAGTLALLLAGPQLEASLHLFEQATRQKLGYALAGENSFLPPAGALFLFPFLMGGRRPGFFDQEWWGPSWPCEVLGYVGLASLVLAFVAVRRLYRTSRNGADDDVLRPLVPLVRTWTWIGLGAAVFMLGYYLPTYRLVHAVPILGVVRCPARMVLALDLALAVLAAVGIHALRHAGPSARLERARETLRRAATFGLPLLMVAVPALFAVAALATWSFWADRIPWPLQGGSRDVLHAVRPWSPALWVPLVLCALTVWALRAFLTRPKSRGIALIALLLLDLFVVARFVDIPPAGTPPTDPTTSPAARFLADRLLAAPGDEGTYRAWGIADRYHDRPAELLMPKPAHALHVATINSYGPFQSPAHTHLFEFRHWGGNRSRDRLLRENHLLSLYGVRYVLTADPGVRARIESVRVPDATPPPEGDNLLGTEWRLHRARTEGDTLQLRAPLLVLPSEARQSVELAPDTHYRIALRARGPERGAGHFLAAGIEEPLLGPFDLDEDPLALLAYAEQIGTDWRRFEWSFRTPPGEPVVATFRVYSMSERPIEVRDVSLRAAAPATPRLPAGRGRPGEPVYRRVALLPALEAGAGDVAVYENPYAERLDQRPRARLGETEIEALKWQPRPWLDDPTRAVPDVSFELPGNPTKTLWLTTVPALLLYLVVVLLGAVRRRRREHPASVPA